MAVSTSEIWNEFSKRLRRFVLKRVQDENDAEDVLQEIFCKIHHNVSNLKDEDKLENWIHQITRNAITDHYRRRGKVEAPFPDVPQDGAAVVTPPGTGERADAGLKALRAMIDDLPDKYRQAIILTEYDGLTQKQVAEKLGLSLTGAKSRVQRARKRLKEMLLECCHFEFDRLGNILDYQPKEKACRYCTESPPQE